MRLLSDLATEPTQPVGTRVLVQEDGVIYISLGTTQEQIAARLGWTQGNVWMPEHVERNLAVRHPEIGRPIEAAAYVLSHPDTVSEIPRAPKDVRFIVNASKMRAAGFVTSRRMRLVDLLVELRSIGAEVLLRAYHLAPTRRKQRGTQRWP